MHFLKERFFHRKSSKFGKLKELVERIEFQQRGTIHAHMLLWTEKTIKELIDEHYIRTDIPDPDEEPELHRLVWHIKYILVLRNAAKKETVMGSAIKDSPLHFLKRLFPHLDLLETYIADVEVMNTSCHIMRSSCFCGMATATHNL